MRTDRDQWYDRRLEIRGSLGDYTLESWLAENLALATALAG